MHAQISALAHRRHTGGPGRDHDRDVHRAFTPTLHSSEVQTLGGSQEEIPDCAAPAGTPCSQGRLGHQFECQAQHPFPLPSPTGGRTNSCRMYCTKAPDLLGEKYVIRARASPKPGVFLLPSSAHQPGSFFNVCGDISCSQWRQRRDGVGRGLRDGRGKC